MNPAGSAGPIAVTTDGPVGYILLNRPEAMNAITVELGKELESALRALESQVDVIVIRGAGGNFSVGGDFHELQRLRSQGRDAMAELFTNFARACTVIAELSVPVIAAVEGYAMAGGFELMQASDIVLIHEHATIADTHSNHGMVPGGGSTQRLPRLIGRQRALAHILTGDRLTADEAVAWGLAYRTLASDDFHEAVERFAHTMAKKDRSAVESSKRLVYASLETTLADGLAIEQRTVLDHLTQTSSGAGIQAFTRREGA
ncbi:enoyl-CoA hydratase/isomerase family protein [Rhodococcus aetherivorans]|uniref:enoyl-CoA hydratase/isomerase family protein n=1 Tax=Rhodococcus aetherivorans TaxID=191292 RepID=UPI0005CAE9B4